MPKHHEELSQVLLRKAKADEATLDAVISLPPQMDEIFGFHAQQAAEKALKALLAHCGVGFPRTHNLKDLMDMAGDAGYPLPADLSDLDKLTPYGTLARYEEGDPTRPLDRKVTRDLIRKVLAWSETSMKDKKDRA